MECSVPSTARGSLPGASIVNDPGLVRCHLRMSGRVQGVGFRFFAERVARELGVSGFVRNLPDGRVEVLAEGEKGAVETFIGELRRGPIGAIVRDVTVEWESPAGLKDFVIK